MPIRMDRFMNRTELPTLLYHSSISGSKPVIDKDHLPEDVVASSATVWQHFPGLRGDDYDNHYSSAYLTTSSGPGASFGVLKSPEGIYPPYESQSVDDQWLAGFYYNVKNGTAAPAYGPPGPDALDQAVMVSSFGLSQSHATPWKLYESSPAASENAGIGTEKRKRRRIISVDQRRAANVRERRRMSHLNEAFDGLRKRVPTFAYEKKLSRIETLRLAVTYIKFMGDLIGTFSEKGGIESSPGKGLGNEDTGTSICNIRCGPVVVPTQTKMSDLSEVRLLLEQQPQQPCRYDDQYKRNDKNSIIGGVQKMDEEKEEDVPLELTNYRDLDADPRFHHSPKTITEKSEDV